MADMQQFILVDANERNPRNDGATIIELKNGTLFMAFMAHIGVEEHNNIGYDHSPCQIDSMISKDGGLTWTDRKIFVENNTGDTNIHYPWFLRLQSGDIMFYYVRYHVLKPGEHSQSTSYISISSDEGETWSDPVEQPAINAGSWAMQMSTGRIILPDNKSIGEWDWCGGPMDIEIGGRKVLPLGAYSDHFVAGCCYSDDEGKTWQVSETWADAPLRGAMEPHIVELNDSRLMMYLRTQLGAVFHSYSDDAGVTWSDPQTTGVKAPESMPTLTKIPQTGDLMLVWNNSQYQPGFDHSGRRSPLTVAISRDEGQTWENHKNIETDRLYEFTNPMCYYTSQGKVIIVYFKSKMANPEFPGKNGRGCIPLKAVVADIDWLYE
jgi:sialidase-1